MCRLAGRQELIKGFKLFPEGYGDWILDGQFQWSWQGPHVSGGLSMENYWNVYKKTPDRFLCFHVNIDFLKSQKGPNESSNQSIIQ